MSVRNTDGRGPDHDDPAGDSAQGAPQLESGHGPTDRSTEFFVNQAFIDAHGVEAAQRLRAVVEAVGARNDGDIVAVREELESGLAQAGLDVDPVEVEKFADRIARSTATRVAVEDLHEGERRDQNLLDGR